MSSFLRIIRIGTYLQRPDIRRVLKNASWLFVNNTVRLVLGILVGAWVARYLGVQQFGQLNLVIAYVALAVPLARLGLDNVVIRRVVEMPEQTGAVLGTAFYLKLVACLILAVILLLMIRLLHPTQPVLLVIGALLGVGSIFLAFVDVIVMWFLAKVEAQYVSLVRTVGLLTVAALKLGAMFFSLSFFTIVLIYALDPLIFALLCVGVYLLVRGRVDAVHGRVRWTVRWNVARSLLRESWPLIFVGLAISVYMRIDQVMLGQLLPMDEAERSVGIYSVAVRIAEMWLFVPDALLASLLPALFLSKQESVSLYHKRLQRLFNLIVLVSYFFAIGLTLASGWIINILYGPDYAAATPALVILIWAGVWAALGSARGSILLAEKANLFTLWATLIGALTNIALNFVLIPPAGFIGSAIATLISYIVSAHLASLLFRRTRALGIMQTKALLYPNPFAESGL